MEVISAQAADAPRICTVILGSGRSGTSAVSRLLALIGVRANFTLDQAGETNPLGYGEDAFIVDSHKRIATAIGKGSVVPVREATLRRAEVLDICSEIQRYLLENTAPGDPWGFKDPRTSDYLPMWRRIFIQSRITPKYILCVRDPATVLASFVMAFANTPEKAKLIWLNRTINALYETGFSCFIIHYEALIADPVAIARDLARFVFGKEGEARVDEAAVRDLIRPDLNRAATHRTVAAGPLATKLYEALKDASGAHFPRELLVSVVQEIVGIRETFLPWIAEGKKGPATAHQKLENELEQLRSLCSAVVGENSNLTKLNLESRAVIEQLQSRLIMAEGKIAAVRASKSKDAEKAEVNRARNASKISKAAKTKETGESWTMASIRRKPRKIGRWLLRTIRAKT